MTRHLEEGLRYSWSKERFWVESLSEPHFKRAFDEMDVYCDLLIFYEESDISIRSQLEGFILAF